MRQTLFIALSCLALISCKNENVATKEHIDPLAGTENSSELRYLPFELHQEQIEEIQKVNPSYFDDKYYDILGED